MGLCNLIGERHNISAPAMIAVCAGGGGFYASLYDLINNYFATAQYEAAQKPSTADFGLTVHTLQTGNVTWDVNFKTPGTYNYTIYGNNGVTAGTVTVTSSPELVEIRQGNVLIVS